METSHILASFVGSNDTVFVQAFQIFFFPTDFDHIGKRLNIREMSFINVLNESIQTESMNFKQTVSLNFTTFSHTFSALV